MPKLKVLLMLALLVACGYGSAALNSVPGTSDPLPYPQQREAHACYHDNQDDYHIYGSTQWAVRFDFQDFYPGVADCRFITSKVRIFFPNAASQATVSLFADADSLPTGNALRQVSAPISNQVMEFTFPDTLSASVIWLVVDYPANGLSSFVSASAGGGSHSYYLDTTAPVPFLQSMNAAGFRCELAFGLVGSFALDSPDLELVSFGLSGALLPRQSVSPVFSIYNHSTSPITDAAILVEFSCPDSSFAISDTIAISQNIAPQDSLIISAPGYPGYSYELPQSPMQIRVKATLYFGTSEPANLFHNNLSTAYYGIYANPYPFYPVENFLRLNTVNSILPLQDGMLSPRMRSLLYFPDLGDSLGNLASRDRFDWYAYNTYPTLAINGSQRIYGFPPGYSNRLQILQDNALSLNTFISRDTVMVEHIPDTDLLQLTFKLTNGETLLYDTASLNPALQSRFFAGLFRRVNLAGSTRFVLQRWIAFADTLSNPLLLEGIISKSYTFNRPNLTNEELIQDYCIFYWLQNRDGGQIHFAGDFNFSPENFTAVDDNYIPAPQPRLYPNPLKGAAELKIADLEKGALLSIYNLRGQLIWKTRASKSSLAIPDYIFPASGIYIVKIASPTPGKPSLTKKITYIK